MKIYKKVLIITFSLLSLYAIITFILVMTQQDRYCAYFIGTEDRQIIYYEDLYYNDVTDIEELVNIDKEVNGLWNTDGEVVLYAPIKFPYFDYYVPDVMNCHLYYSENKKYIWVHCPFEGSTRTYVRGNN